MSKPDPLAANLERSLDDETAAVQRRFANADRHVQTDQPHTVVRASFSFPANDHALFDLLQQRAIGAGVAPTRSALVRAGLHALMRMPDTELVAALGRLVELRPGPRPAGRA